MAGRRPRSQYGSPKITFPTLNIDDVIIVDEQDYNAGTWEPSAPGTPRPGDPTALLVLQRIVEKNPNRQSVQSIYMTARNSSQAAYNDEIDYEHEDTSYPLILRQSVELRRSYAPLTMLSKLTAITNVVIDSQGSGYAATTVATITGGGGSGAQIGLEIQSGKIVSAYIINGGTGYTTAPTLGFANTGGAVGAAGTISIQSQTALLISQKKKKIEGEIGSLFVLVQRVYQILPGAILTGKLLSGEAQGALATLTKRMLEASAADYAPTFRTLSYTDQPVDVSRKERTLVELTAGVNTTEVSTVSTAGKTVFDLAGKYFTLQDAATDDYVWFNLNGGSTDPALPGRRGIAVTLTGAAAETQTVDVTGLGTADLAGKYFTLADSGGNVYGWFNRNNSSTDPAPGGRGIEIDINAALPEIQTINVSGATPTSLDGKYFTLADANGSVYVWFAKNGLATDPAAATRGLKVTLNNAQPEIQTVDTTGATPAGLADTYFSLADSGGSVYVWFNLDAGGFDPAPFGRGIEVAIATGDTVGQIATAIKNAVDADAGFSATVSTNTVTITDAANGSRTDIHNGTSGLTVATTQQGGATTDTDAQIATAIKVKLDADAFFSATVASTTVTITDASNGTRTDINAGDTGEVVATTQQGGATEMTDVDIAAAIAASLEADSGFTATSAGAVATITDANTGTRTDATDGNTDLVVTTTQQGAAGAAMTDAQIATAIASAVDADTGFLASAAGTTVTITDASPGQRTDITPGTSGLTVAVTTQGGTGADFPVLRDYDQDPQHLSLISTTYQVVDAATVTAPTSIYGQVTRYKHIDKWRSMKIVETYAVPATYEEQRFAGYSFPSLLRSYYHSSACGVFMDARDGFSAHVETVTQISFGFKQTIAGLSIRPASYAIANFRVSNVLNDRFTLRSTEAGCSFSTVIAATTPSKAAYEAAIGTLQLVSGESVLWRAGIYRTTKLYVRMI